MKKMLFILILAGMVLVQARADVYVEAKTMGGTSKTWTSGLKQRAEIPSLMGNSVLTITRVDKGVVWNIDPKHKVYEEKPIPMAYHKMDTPTPLDQGEESPDSDPEGGKMSINKLPDNRTIAGLPATGYEIRQGDKQGTAVLWMTPVTGTIEIVQRETAAYQEAYQKKLLENYPASERKDASAIGKGMSHLFRGEISSMFKAYKGLPSGYTLGMEGIGNMPGESSPQKMNIFEVQSLSVEPIDTSFFEEPAHFQKVNSIAEYQMKDMMHGINMDELMKKMPKHDGE